MKRIICLLTIVLLTSLLSTAADDSFIVELSDGSASSVEADHSLSDLEAVPEHGVYLVTSSNGATSGETLNALTNDPRVAAVEVNSTVTTPEVNGPGKLNQSTAAILDGLSGRKVISYYGSQVASNYVNQPATAMIGLAGAQQKLSLTGGGVVAIIDTGVDPNHVALQSVLVPGYDFTRNVAGIPSELADLPPNAAAALNQSTAAILDKRVVATLNQSTAAILDQSTAAILDPATLPAAFGHGTMVAGIVHLVAPTAQIMPLKAFQSDGTGNLFDIIRAIYFAVDHGANVINMSFNLVSSSPAVMDAISYAHAHHVLTMSSAGNDGKRKLVYPAGMKNVFGIASIDNSSRCSRFSNFGSSIVDLAAPGEGVITTYPGNNYAAGWGTSFSTPFVTGAGALLEQLDRGLSPAEANDAFTKSKPLDPALGHGRLSLVDTLQYYMLEMSLNATEHSRSADTGDQ